MQALSHIPSKTVTSGYRIIFSEQSDEKNGFSIDINVT